MLKIILPLVVSGVLGFSILSIYQKKEVPPRTLDFNDDWQFALADSAYVALDHPDTLTWREVQLPHDWSIEYPFDSLHNGATGYLPGGVGWYRKQFSHPADGSQVVYLYFDGIYNNSEVWVNDQKLGFHPYGYSPFYYNITSYLNRDGSDNLVEVKVDRTRYVDSRWYTGSGIYRDVKLITAPKLHVPVWGTFITTPNVSTEQATVRMEVAVKNDFTEPQAFTLKTTLHQPDGIQVAESTGELTLSPGQEQTFTQEATVNAPQLWDTENPQQYTAITTILQKGDELDRYETPFGIRSIRFDASEGFFLNGKRTLIKGVCLHHDGGLVGAAVPRGVWRQRLETLKAGGCNAIRISHNPGSEEFLDLCDEMGFLVQNEFFDEWDNPKDKRLNQQERHDDYISRGYAEHFQEWAERDLKNTMRRDRNHPSIIQWCIGNEIEWTYPRYAHASGYFNMSWEGNYFWEKPPISPDEIKQRYEESSVEGYVLAETAQKLANWTREMDTTRAVIANCILPSVSHVSGYTDALDVVGYSYRRVLYDYGHEHYPDKPIMGTENLPQWHEWKSVIERPFIAGTFLWTGIDYMGESHAQWPRKSTPSGLLNTAGFAKPSYHMMKTLWNDNPHVYLATQTAEKSIYKIDEASGEPVEREPGAWEKALWFWHDVNEHWNYPENCMTVVEVYSNCEEVELLLNGESMGIKHLTDFEDRIYKWAVPFSAGTLEAQGTKNGQLFTTQHVTASEPSGIQLSVDHETIEADGESVAHVVAQLVDADGNLVKHEEREITFQPQGDITLLGVDNGAPDNVQKYQSNQLVTKDGRALLIVQSTEKKSTAKIKAQGEGLSSNEITIITQ
ncbi:MAG: glycoside hydrolase family 2 TIM barrel-domain containing protein [Bacteroidota bacterium]